MEPNTNLSQHIRSSLESAFRDYTNESAIFFDYLKEQAARGLSSTQFSAYRDNYLYRTAYTPIAVAKVVIAAVRAGDNFGIERAGKNLYEETGEGHDNMSHPGLLQNSYDTHGRVVYGLPPIPLRQVEHSSYMLDEARDFRRMQEQNYDSSCYRTVLGASFAQEAAARDMLEAFYQHVFLPRKSAYASEGEFASVAHYFLVHINGLEEAHAGDALEVLVRACKSELDFAPALQAAQTFWKAQSALWRAMQMQLVALS